MAKVLTKASEVKCAHSGKASLSSSALLKVGGDPVLREADVKGASLSGCSTTNRSPTQANQTKDVKCSSVSSVATDEATKLMADGKPVSLDTLTGMSDGTLADVTPLPGVSASAKQSKLTAI